MYKARPVGVHVNLTHSGQWSTARPLCPNFEAVYGMTQSHQHMVDSSGFLIAEAITSKLINGAYIRIIRRS